MIALKYFSMCGGTRKKVVEQRWVTKEHEKTLNGAKYLSHGHGSNIDSVLIPLPCPRD